MHFLLIGLAVFGFFAVADDRETSPSVQEIIITDSMISQFANRFENIWNRPPNQRELEGLIDNYIREEVLTREAMALSLDKNDTVIRQRLRQKMEFLTQSAAAALEPTDNELQSYFDENIDTYAFKGAVAFDQIFIGENSTEAEIGQVRADLDAGVIPEAVGTPTLLPNSLPLSPQTVVDRFFGNRFYDGLAEAEPGVWFGPVKSGYGVHFVRVTERKPGTVPKLNAVLEKVLRDWRAQKSKDLAEEQFARMAQRYTIERPDLSTSGSKPQ